MIRRCGVLHQKSHTRLDMATRDKERDGLHGPFVRTIRRWDVQLRYCMRCIPKSLQCSLACIDLTASLLLDFPWMVSNCFFGGGGDMTA